MDPIIDGTFYYTTIKKCYPSSLALIDNVVKSNANLLQLAMWGVVIGKDVSSYSPLSHLYQSQLVTWRRVVIVPNLVVLALLCCKLSVLISLGCDEN